ncbi:hypothetical protein [Actinomadura verrucosospora]|uniref:Uncharacterized protein n=1 Tax=Actinomadura verrucosospora TaxID=46165 RepID=A0A7D3ZX72_ACTVE|nr:hypothetical protein [Actinomadura verrucosospora]QKG20504.1 hypothetical protein ACTIVE_2142 [Actinomadura verrucosospora]
MGHGSGSGRTPRGTAPFGEPGAGVAGTGLADAALIAITADDLRDVLRAGPQPLVRALMSVAGLRHAKKVPAAVAEALLRILRHGEPQKRADLRGLLGADGMPGFDNADGLDAADCAGLLEAGTAQEVLDRAPLLRRSLSWETPAAVMRWRLACAVESGAALAPLALGLLQADAGGPDDPVVAAWTDLRREHPRLPEQPIGVGELAAMARRPPTRPAPEDDAVDGQDAEEDAVEPAEMVGRLRARVPFGAEAAERVAGALREGRRPDEGDLSAVDAVVAAFDEVRDRLAEFAAWEGPADLEAFSAVLDGILDARERGARTTALIGLEGPGIAADALAKVRDMARSGGGPGLAALADLIDAAARPDDLPRAAALAEQARDELPADCGRLVDLALMGHLTFGATSAETDDTAPPEPEPEPEQEPGQTDLPDDSADDADLADLDELLAETFPGRPSARTIPTSPPEPEPEPELQPQPQPEAEPEPTARSAGTPERPAAAHRADGPHAEATGGDAVPDKAAAGDRASAPAMTDELVQAEAAALRAGRFGLAGRLRTTAGRPAAEARVRRCAALAVEMVAFAGVLSAEFAEAARGLDARALADDPAGRLLAWAAAIRAGLVHPTPESTRLLEELSVIVSADTELAACGEAFTRAARSGAYLGPGLAGRIRGSAEAARVRRNAVAEARRLREEAPHQKIRYQLATEVWKSLLQSDGQDGRVGMLLAIAESDDPSRADEVIAKVTELRSGDAVNRLIDECSGRIAARRKNKKIIARAHAQLVKKVENALDTAASWAAAVKEAAAPAGADAQDWRLGPLGQLQEAVGDRRGPVDAALARIGAAPGDPARSAAADAARVLLGQAFDLLAGAPLAAQEPPVAHAVNRHLLLAPGVGVAPSTFEPLAPPTADDLVPVALAETEDWTAAFERRAARLDHEGTRAIAAVVERRDPAAAAELRERRDALVAEARAARDARVEGARDRVAVWLRDGVLTEDEVRAAEEALRSLAGDRVDFDRVGKALDDLHAGLEAARLARIGRERPLLEERMRRAGIGAADRDRVSERVEAGDLTTAREFMAQVEAGNPLPAAAEHAEHLDRFYPAFPKAFSAIAVRAGNRARKQETNEGLTELMDALQRGRDVADPDLAALLGGAQIKIPALRNARREEAREGLRQWKACGLGSKTDATLRTGITAILKMIGLEGEQRDGAREQHRRWIDLEGVKPVGETLLPAFGSRMSPSGDRLRLVLVWRRPGPQQLIELLKGQPEDQTILVFYFGVLAAEERRQLAVAARRRPSPVTAVLDDAAIGYLACMPEADWSAAVALTAPFTATNPYAPVGDVPDEMFYGRRAQLRDVTGRTRCSFVYGGRQLGKSALLRKAQRDIRRTDPDRKVILENIQTVGKAAPAESLWPKLADKLAGAGVIPAGVVQRDQVRDAVRDWVRRDPARQVLVLLDEADQFLNQDADDGQFQNVTALRDLMDDTDDRFKVVFAGLHQTARFQSLPNQPLAHLGTPVAVGPLEPQNAFDLLVRPLAALGFRFPETLAARVIAEANNAPALVQLFAEALLARLRRNPLTARTLPYEITRDDVEAVWRDASLVRGFGDRFEWTLNLDKRYKVIAYTVALHALAVGADETLSVGELWEQCQNAWAEGFEACTSDGFRGLLDECVNLGVLGLSGGRYRLRTPHILNLLGGIDDVQKVLDGAEEFELPDSFDAHSYRGAYRDGPERSPLSSAQIARITRPHDLVHVVAGSRALHADRVHPALRAEQTERTDLRVLRAAPGELTFDGALARADRHDGHTVIVVDVPDGKSRRQFEQRLRAAREAVAGHARGTLAVVLVAGASLAPAWVSAAADDGVELVELRRFDGPAVRQWMSEDSQQGFPDEAGQEALLVRTGGWPALIGQIVQRLAEHGGGREQVLDDCDRQLRDAPADFVRSTGVLADRCLAAAWRAFAADETPDVPDELAMLLELHGEENVADLSPAALADLGYTGTADLVEALRVLGALVPADGRRLRCEPVLAAATRRMEEA